jgi:hypothetical protein
MDKEPVTLSIRVPKPLREFLDQAAEIEHVSLSDLVRWALLDFALVSTTPALAARRDYLAALYRVYSTDDEETEDWQDANRDLTQRLEELVSFGREAMHRPEPLDGHELGDPIREAIRSVIREMRDAGEL